MAQHDTSTLVLICASPVDRVRYTTADSKVDARGHGVNGTG